MASGTTERRPAYQHSFPNEILINIAEACVEPYSIAVKLHAHTTLDTPIFTIHRTTRAVRLAFISRYFCTGIKKGLQTNFDGHLSLPPIYPREATKFLLDKNMTWVVEKATQLVVVGDNTNTPRLTLRRSILEPFKHLKHLELRTMTHNSWFYDALQCHGADYATLLLSRNRSTNRTNSNEVEDGRLIVLLQWVAAPSENTDAKQKSFEYINVQARITRTECDVLKIYTTKTLKWRTRVDSNDEDDVEDNTLQPTNQDRRCSCYRGLI